MNIPIRRLTWLSPCGVALIFSACAGPAPSDNSNGQSNANANDNVAFPADTMRTIAGTGASGFGGDGGPATSAQLNQPMDLALAADGALLIADFGNHRIRRVDLATGIITTVAGNGLAVGENALPSPTGVRPLGDGGFLAVSWSGHQVFRHSSDGSRTVVFGTGADDCTADDVAGVASEIATSYPRSVDVLSDGSLLVSEQGCNRVRRIRNETVVPYAGTGERGFSGDGASAIMAALSPGLVEEGPSFGLSLSPEDPPDELFIADTDNHVIRQVKTFTNRMETLAGTGEPGYHDAVTNLARFDTPTHVFTARDHSVWIADTGNHAIRYVDPLAVRVITVAGTGEAGFNGDGLPPTETQLRTPTAVLATPDGRVFIADGGNHRVRMYTRSEFVAP